MLQLIKDYLTPQERRVIGEEARQLLENKHLNGAFTAVDEYIDQVALSCDPDDRDKAQRVILSKQLLAAIRQEIVRKIEDGQVAKVEIEELEKRSRPRMFQR